MKFKILKLMHENTPESTPTLHPIDPIPEQSVSCCFNQSKVSSSERQSTCCFHITFFSRATVATSHRYRHRIYFQCTRQRTKFSPRTNNETRNCGAAIKLRHKLHPATKSGVRCENMSCPIVPVQSHFIVRLSER
jgi:hypothetical protein